MITNHTSRLNRGLFVVAACGAVATALTVYAPAASAATTSGFVTMASDSGDYIGGGTARDWWTSTGGGSIAVSGNASGISVSVSGGPSGSSFTFSLAPPAGETFADGDYENAQRTSFRSAGHPGIDIYGEGRGCNETTGRFVVRDVAFDGTGTLQRLDLSYEQHCEGGVSALFGQISLNEPAADPNVLVLPANITFPSTYPGTTSTVARVRVVNTGASPLHPASVTLGGTDADAFQVRSDACSGATVAAGASCLATVRFAPAAGRTASAQATLTETDDSSVGSHAVALSGSVVPGYTSWEMTGDSGDYITGGQHYKWTPANAQIGASGTDSHFSVSLTSGTDRWDADFSAPSGDVLAPGDYTGAVRDPFRGNSAGLEVSGAGRGCNTISGSFHVYEYTIDPATNDVKSASITWVQHCEGGSSASYGSIAWHASAPAHSPGGPTGSTGSTSVHLSAPHVFIYKQAHAVSVSVKDGASGIPVPSVTVRLLARPHGTSSWTVRDSGTTGGDGIAHLSLKLTRKSDLKAKFGGTATHKADSSGAQTVSVAPHLRGSYLTEVPVGGNEVVHGTVVPNLSGHRIYLQEIRQGSWVTVRSDVLSSRSRFRWSFPMRHRGTFSFRLYLEPTKRFVAAGSKTFTVTVA
jgi:hypothetical protein